MHRIRNALLAVVAGTAAAVAAPAGIGAAAGPSPHHSWLESTDIVVKVAPGHTIGEVTADYAVAVERAVLASRAIYLVRPTDPDVAQDPRQALRLAWTMSRNSSMISYAELDQSVQLSDTQFHGWPWGSPRFVGRHLSTYTHQRLVTAMRLGGARALAKGAGTKVAVLDTGADADQPALAGRLGPGWNYIDDNADSADVASGLDEDHDGYVDSAYGHGTFVSGIVALVAPQATILPYRVLDSDGYGSLYEVAQAILDAVAAGADVINLSFGTSDAIWSFVLADAINRALHAGVLVVAATGNDASSDPHYPAALPGVLSTSALRTGTRLAPFSDYGWWADVAAPGTNIVGPLPHHRFARWAGTSMAAPIVSAQAALLFSTRPDHPLATVQSAITGTTRSLSERGTVKYGAVDIVGSLRWLAEHR